MYIQFEAAVDFQHNLWILYHHHNPNHFKSILRVESCVQACMCATYFQSEGVVAWNIKVRYPYLSKYNQGLHIINYRSNNQLLINQQAKAFLFMSNGIA